MFCLLLSLSVALLAFKPARSVPCRQIGKAFYDEDGERKPQLDPFQAGQGFDIIEPQKCYHRFQSPDWAAAQGGSRLEFAEALENSRVTRSTWDCTEDAFRATCNNFFNADSSNEQLWLVGDTAPYQYAGLLLRGQTEPQESLSRNPATVLTYLLPSGVSKVTTVVGGRNDDRNCQRMITAGGIGLSGNVDPAEDYAYTSILRVSLALAARFPDGRDRKLYEDEYGPWHQTDGAFVTAEKANGECVVIDYRNLPTYMLNREGYPDAKVTQCS